MRDELNAAAIDTQTAFAPIDHTTSELNQDTFTEHMDDLLDLTKFDSDEDETLLEQVLQDDLTSEMTPEMLQDEFTKVPEVDTKVPKAGVTNCVVGDENHNRANFDIIREYVARDDVSKVNLPVTPSPTTSVHGGMSSMAPSSSSCYTKKSSGSCPETVISQLAASTVFTAVTPTPVKSTMVMHPGTGMMFQTPYGAVRSMYPQMMMHRPLLDQSLPLPLPPKRKKNKRAVSAEVTPALASNVMRTHLIRLPSKR